MRLRILCVGEKMARGYCPTLFNYHTARGKGKTDSSNAWLLPLFASYSLQVTRSSYSVERAMEVLLQDLRGAALMLPNCTATFFSFRPPDCTGEQPTNQPDDDDGCCYCRFFFNPKTDVFKYYYSLITLSHSLRLRPLLLQTHTTRSSFLSPNGGNFPYKEGNFFPSTLLATLLNFQISRRRGGSHVTWEVEGVILFLKKSLPPPE